MSFVKPFYEKFTKQHMKKQIDFTVFSDGGSRGNPGEAACGFIIYNSEREVFHQAGVRLGINTNNVAEYMGVLKALEFLTKNTQNRPLNVACFMDSQLVANQLSDKWKLKNETLRGLYFSVKELEQQMGTVMYTPVPREQNKEADRLVNQALDGII